MHGQTRCGLCKQRTSSYDVPYFCAMSRTYYKHHGSQNFNTRTKRPLAAVAINTQATRGTHNKYSTVRARRSEFRRCLSCLESSLVLMNIPSSHDSFHNIWQFDVKYVKSCPRQSLAAFRVVWTHNLPLWVCRKLLLEKRR